MDILGEGATSFGFRTSGRRTFTKPRPKKLAHRPALIRHVLTGPRQEGCNRTQWARAPLQLTILHTQARPMAKNLTIVSAKCIKPSSGIDSVAFTIFDEFFAGTDKLYVKVNGARIYPSKECVDRNLRQAKQVGCSTPLSSYLTIQLWGKYAMGSDDLLGSIILGPDHKTGDFSYVVTNHNEGSICQIHIRIREDLLEKSSLARCGKPARSVAARDLILSLEEEWEFFKATRIASL